LKLYLEFQKKALLKKEAFNLQHIDTIPEWQERILRKTLKSLEETVIEDLSRKELVSERFGHILRIKEEDFHGFLEQHEEDIIEHKEK
jgi:hypothetical protein